MVKLEEDRLIASGIRCIFAYLQLATSDDHPVSIQTSHHQQEDHVSNIHRDFENSGTSGITGQRSSAHGSWWCGNGHVSLQTDASSCVQVALAFVEKSSINSWGRSAKFPDLLRVKRTRSAWGLDAEPEFYSQQTCDPRGKGRGYWMSVFVFTWPCPWCKCLAVSSAVRSKTD